MKKIHYKDFYGGDAVISERRDKTFLLTCRGRNMEITKKSIHKNEAAAKSALYRYGGGSYTHICTEK